MIVGTLLSLLSVGTVGAGDVSRTAPDLFNDSAADLLTPIDVVLEMDASDLEDDRVGGILLLDEEVHFLSESGESLIVFHRVAKPLTEAGVDSASRSTTPFLKDLQKPHLILARTIRPDGSREDVAPQAAFIQTPQYLADQRIFTDVGELVVVFPDVKPGNIVESIIVVEQREPRIPGHFSGVFSFATYWPTALLNTVVDLPRATAEQLHISELGTGVPAMQRISPNENRERLVWSDTDRKRVHWEIGREPSSQGGPAVWLTTWSSWNDVADWYRGLITADADLDDELKSLVDQWTGETEESGEILAILFDHVSNDIRYVGLEFGLGALKPRTGAEVWRSQYGDCKDKAALLRSMLRYRGITAHMVLLNTLHRGRFDLDSPSHRHFNHAIVAVETDDGLLFCDPTIERSKPGILPPGDGNRAVLVITEEEGRIVRTPEVSAGDFNVAFDLDMEPDGTLRGWFEMSATDYYGAAYADSFSTLNRQSRKENLASIIQSFFPAAELIDFDPPEVSEPARCALRAFFVVDGVYRDPRTLRQLELPEGGYIFPYLGEEKERETVYFQRIEQNEVSVTYTLPPGWSPRQPPPPELEIKGPGLEIGLSWSTEQHTVTGRLRYRISQSVVDPSSFARLYQSISSATAWLETPVIVGPTEDDQQSPASERPSILDMPMMPTGEGQLSLVDHLYPIGGDSAIRRRALERVLQLFPDDETTAFDTHIQLAILDYDNDRSDDAIRRIEDLLARASTAIDREDRAWARYILSIFLEESGRAETSRTILQSIADDDELSDERRAWACFRLASARLEQQPEEAMELIEKGLAFHAPGPTADLLILLAEEDFRADQHFDRLEPRLERLVEETPLIAESVLGSLAEEAINWSLEGSARRTSALVPVLERLRESNADLAFLDELMTPLRDILSTVEAYRNIAGEIADFIENSTPDWWETVPGTSDASDLAGSLALLEDYSKSNRYRSWVRSTIEILARYWDEIDDFGNRLWRLGSTIQANDRESPLLDRVISWCEQLPKSDDGYWEARFLRRDRVRDREGAEGLLAFYQAILEDPELPTSYRIAAVLRTAAVHEERKEFDRALALYSEIEPVRNRNINAFEGILRAARIRISRGEYDEAVRLIGLMAELEQFDLDRLDASEEMLSALELVRRPEVAAAWWSGRDRWWPRWLELRQKLELEADEDLILTEPIGDKAAFGGRIGTAKRENSLKEFHELYRRLVHAVWWDPAFVPEISSVGSIYREVSPQTEDQFRAFTVAIHEAVVATIPDDESIQQSLLQITIEYTDWFHTDEALETIRRYFEEFSDDTPIAAGMVRLWALNALRSGTDREKVVELLEKQLETMELGRYRGFSVDLLGHLYLSLGRGEDELRLLQREINEGHILESDGKRESLLARLRQLEHEGDQTLEFSIAFDEWFGRFKPGWFDFARPADLEDPEISDVETAVTDGDPQLTATESAKLRLLVAGDPSFPLGLRQQALVKAADYLADLEALIPAATAIRESVIEEPRFGVAARTDMLWLAMFDALLNRDSATIHRLADNDVLDSLSADRSERYAKVASLAVDDPTDAPSLAAAIESILDDTVDPLEIFAVSLDFDRLLALGALDSAEAIVERLKDLRLESDVTASKMSIRLEFTRKLRQVRDISRTASEMKTALFEAYPPPETEPPRFRTLRRSASVYRRLDPEEAFRLRLWRLHQEVISPNNQIWTSVCRYLNIYRDDTGTVEKLARIAVEGAPDDTARSSLVLDIWSWIDADREADREMITSILTPYRNPETSPDTFAAIRLTEIFSALRSGSKIDPEAEFNTLDHRLISFFRLGTLLEYSVQRGDGSSLRRILRYSDPEQLVKPYTVGLALRAARLAGLEDELELIEEAATRTRYESILESWATGDVQPAFRAFEISEALGVGADYPKEWLRDLVAGLDDELLVARILLEDARLREDWAGMVEYSSEILETMPRLYDVYWDLGTALSRLGRTEEAIAALKVFTNFSHDHIDYPQALKLLERLESDS